MIFSFTDYLRVRVEEDMNLEAGGYFGNNFLKIKLAGIKKICIFAVPIRGAQENVGLMGLRS